jgi:hypothetical protein
MLSMTVLERSEGCNTFKVSIPNGLHRPSRRCHPECNEGSLLRFKVLFYLSIPNGLHAVLPEKYCQKE